MGQMLAHSGSRRRWPSHPLISAIASGDTHYLADFLRLEPIALNQNTLFCNNDVLTCLHLSAFLGQLQILSLLLEAGASSNARTNTGKTPLMVACKARKPLIVERLLEHDADVLAFEYSNRRTCLHYACREGSIECVQNILNVAQSGLVASSWGFFRYVNIRDGKGVTPLHMAARYGHTEIVKLLLHNGALVLTMTSTAHTGGGYGFSPLHCAAMGGNRNIECIHELLAWGADRAQEDTMGRTAFDIIISGKKDSMNGRGSILDPNAEEAIVWPSPWRFMSERELDPRVKAILELALKSATTNQDISIQEASNNIGQVEDICGICMESKKVLISTDKHIKFQQLPMEGMPNYYSCIDSLLSPINKEKHGKIGYTKLLRVASRYRFESFGDQGVAPLHLFIVLL